ncbi:MAG: helix-turn-helix domain containing protein [Actinomycetota bacterium]|nr:helix-turn-helix domain containing protein [Actinomycetota bacterium]
MTSAGAPGHSTPREAGRRWRTLRLTGDERRRQLCAVALALFAERGYESTTMDEIAEMAGVTKPLLYQHFSSKRGLYLELVDTVAEDLLSEISAATAAAGGPREQVEDGFAAYCRMVVTHETAFRLLYSRSSRTDAERGSALRRVEDAIAEAIDPLIAAGLDPDHRRFLAYAVVGMAEGASRHWIETRRADTLARSDQRRLDEEAQRLARRLANLAWAGLRAIHAD